jgi:hypothetical protein
MILASITYYLLSLILTPEQFINYSWRIAFIFGGLMMFFSYYQRRSLNETLPEMPLMEGVVGLNLLKKEKLKLFSSILIAASSAVFVSVIIVFLPTYCQKFLNIDAQTTASFGLVCVLTYATSTLFGGLIAEKMNHQNTLILGVFIAFLSLIPLAYFLVNHYFLSAMIFFVIFSFANGLINANYMCMILNQFKASERFSGLAISQNVAMAIFTGLLPLLLTYMLSKWMIILAPFYLLITLYLVALFGLFITRKMKG